ncbi:phytase [Idiomarina xiamenensis]|uniref:3-phytase n=1 Tax=Idiomarina xiamenensis 10-D-4 TaxID=740709 RepID=K2K3B9_9GAMM|nr:phytase [Idiomarina xiamenensis]EKE82108.1 3-phytase [Idiomarina xiamenensis 10-D-4]
MILKYDFVLPRIAYSMLTLIAVMGLQACADSNASAPAAATDKSLSLTPAEAVTYRFSDDSNGILVAADQQQLWWQEDRHQALPKLLAKGDFEHLRAKQLVDGGTVFTAIDGDSQYLHYWLLDEAGETQSLWQGEVTSRVVEDLCFFQSGENQQLSLFILGGRGGAEQWLLKQDQQWLAEPLLIREFGVPYDATSCVVDDANAALYIAEADQALWRYQAEPEADEGRTLIDARQPLGHIRGEIKALAMQGDVLWALEEQPARLQAYRQQQWQGSWLLRHQAQAMTLTDIDVSGAQAWVSADDKAQSYRFSLPLASTTTASLPKAVEQVSATLQTEPTERRGDAMDDPAVWVNAQQPGQSRILATDKRAGLDVYDMQGRRVQQLSVGRLNNVDVRYGLTRNGQRRDIAVASLRDNNSLQLFSIDSKGQLTAVEQVSTGMSDIYGLCLGQQPGDDAVSVYVNDKSGLIQQYRVTAAAQGWQAKLVRELRVPSQPEGCVVDDQQQWLYVGEEDVAVWRFAAAADADSDGEAIIKVAEYAELEADIEGLALADGYLVVSSQGNDSYILFQQQPPYALIKHFRIRTNTDLGIDGVSETDGLEVTTRSLGAGFEEGALVVQDGRNRMPEAGQNIKLVPWQWVKPK